MYYDTQFIRQKKLSRIVGEEIEYPIRPTGICLFEQDYKNGYLYIDYVEITSFFYKNYSSKWSDIKELIQGWLKEDSKLLTPVFLSFSNIMSLKEDSKLQVLTPSELQVLTPYWMISGNLSTVVTDF